eukprot:806256-Prymnesium_polylepis.1
MFCKPTCPAAYLLQKCATVRLLSACVLRFRSRACTHDGDGATLARLGREAASRRPCRAGKSGVHVRSVRRAA